MTTSDWQWVAACILVFTSLFCVLGSWTWAQEERSADTRWVAILKICVFSLCFGSAAFTVAHYWLDIPKLCVGAVLEALFVYMIVRTVRRIGKLPMFGDGWAGLLLTAVNALVLGMIIYILLP